MVEEDYAELKVEDDVVDEMTASIENGDMSLVSEYEEWYDYVGDKKYIPEYKNEISDIYKELKTKNDYMNKVEFSDLSEEQIQEIILMQSDSTYKVDKELWECE